MQDRLLQKQCPGVAKRRVCHSFSLGVPPLSLFLCREKDLDDVLQISNVFVNVSKGEVAKSNDLKKSFGTDDRNTVVREVCLPLQRNHRHWQIIISNTDSRQRRGSGRREG